MDERRPIDPPPERRHYPRSPVGGRVLFALSEEESGVRLLLDAQLVDVGRGGACLAMSRVIHVGSHAVVRIDVQGKPVIRVVEVRSCRYKIGRGHLIGVRFLGEAPNEAVGELLEEVRSAA